MKLRYTIALLVFIFGLVCFPLYAEEGTSKEINKPLSTHSISIEKVDASLNNSNHFFDFGLEYPVNFGIRLRYLLNSSFYTQFGLGFMHNFFLKGFEEFSSTLGYLTEEEAQIISKTFQGSLYLDLRFAWMPFFKEFEGGPYLEVGASGIFFGKGEVTGSLLSKNFFEEDFDITKKYSIKTNSLNATAHIGYQIPIEKIKLNIEIGLIKILKTKIIDKNTISAPRRLSKKQKQSFQDFLKNKGWIFPTVSGWISFSF